MNKGLWGLKLFVEVALNSSAEAVTKDPEVNFDWDEDQWSAVQLAIQMFCPPEALREGIEYPTKGRLEYTDVAEWFLEQDNTSAGMC